MHEFEFIAWLRELLNKPIDRDRVPMGIGDDMAVINFCGGKLLLGSDMVIENRHFTFPEASPEQVGHKAIGRCLSDCAAMAGEPMAAIVSLARPEKCSDDILKGIFTGMNRLAERFHCPIVGGDTSSSTEGLIIDVCLLGKCEKNEPVLRSGAKFGDFIYVTGLLGGSILGKHLNFMPRIDEAIWLTKNLRISAMIDISDGVSSDLAHLCEESGCGAELFSHYVNVIVSDEARKLSETTGKSSLQHALNDGEDFELLFTSPVSPSELPALPASIKIFPIGRINDRNDITIIHPGGRQEKVLPEGFRHF